MVKIIGVRFRRAGKIYYFDPGDLEISPGQHVIVETTRGIEYGLVALGPRELEDALVSQPLKKVIRIATPEDDDVDAKNREKEKKAYDICLEKIKYYGLEMKLIQVEYTFDNNRILFYFTADGRIDFRELVKNLASIFKTRIELRQIGVRDETKMRGGIGICGRELCCHSFIPDFMPVSIKMAKEQTLSLNPAKISGVCDRLMCCLKYEQDTYEWLNSQMPHVGDIVEADDGLEGVVSNVNVMRQRVRIIVTDENDEKEAHDYDVDRLTVISGKRGRKNTDAKKNGANADTRQNHGGAQEGARQDPEAADAENGPAGMSEENAANGGEHRSSGRKRTDGEHKNGEKKESGSRRGGSHSRPQRRHRDDRNGGRGEGRPENANHGSSGHESRSRRGRKRNERENPGADADHHGGQ